jgi:predicted nucleic acid-binding protein
MIVVVDASVAAMWYLPERHSDRAVGLLGSGHDLVAPVLLRLEVGSALLRAVRRKELTRGEAHQVIRSLLPEAVRFLPLDEEVTAPFEIAERYGGSIYDAVYIALARALRAPISTDDAQLARTARKAGITAVLVKDDFPS